MAPTPTRASEARLVSPGRREREAGVARRQLQVARDDGYSRSRVYARRRPPPGRCTRTSRGSFGDRRRGRRRCWCRSRRGQGGRPSSRRARGRSRATYCHLRGHTGAVSAWQAGPDRALWAPSSSCRGCCAPSNAPTKWSPARRPLRSRTSTPPLTRVGAAPAEGMIFECAKSHACMHEQRAGRHAGARGGARLSEDLRGVDGEVPASCGDVCASARAAGLRAMSSFAAPKITMPVDGYADPPTCFALAGGTQQHQWRAHDRFETDRVRTCIHHGSTFGAP